MFTHRSLPMHYVTEMFGDAERLLQMAVYSSSSAAAAGANGEGVKDEADEIGERMEQDFDAMSLFKL
jgi:hypothetical protein